MGGPRLVQGPTEPACGVNGATCRLLKGVGRGGGERQTRETAEVVRGVPYPPWSLLSR
jgi:hypothetical protein